MAKCWKKKFEKKEWKVYEDKYGGTVDIIPSNGKWKVDINKGLDGTKRFSTKSQASRFANKYMKDNC